MNKRELILARVTAFKDESITLVNLQSTNDIIRALVQVHREEAHEYDKICDLFDEPTAYETGRSIWTFLKRNVNYNIEQDEYQTVRSPGAIVATGQTIGGDCKNYSLFSAGVIDGLNRQGAGIPWCFRFASYDILDSSPKHVFVVMYPGSTEEIWIDPVLEAYDYHKQPCYYRDRNCMLAKVSGIPNGRALGRINRRGRIGQGDGDDIDDIGFDPSSVSADINPGNGVTSDDISSSDFNINALPDQQVSNGPDLSTSSEDFNPTTATNELTQNETESEVNQLDASTSASSGSGNFLSNIFGNLFGGSSSSGSGGGTSSGGSGGTLSTQKSGSGQSSGDTININTGGSSTMSTYMPWIIGGVAVIILAVVLTDKRK